MASDGAHMGIFTKFVAIELKDVWKRNLSTYLSFRLVSNRG